MNNSSQYSDEHINAYIDGELDSEERSRLLYDEQQDSELAARINRARLLKEKVQLAYGFIDDDYLRQRQQRSQKTRARPLFSQPRAIAASLFLIIAAVLSFTTLLRDDGIDAAHQLMQSTPAIAAHRMQAEIGSADRVIIDLNRYQADSFDATLEHIERLVADSRLNVEIVANYDGLRALDTATSRHAGRITALAQRFDNLEVIACAQSLASLAAGDNPVNLVAEIVTTPSASEQVARRSAEGWKYLKLL